MVRQFDHTDKQELDSMIQLRSQLFPGTFDQYYPGNLNLSNFLKGFVFYDNESPEANLILFNSSLVINGKQVLFFGYFDALNFESGKILMQNVLEYCKFNYNNCLLIGPVNSSTWGNYRMAIDRFESHFPGDIAGNSWMPEIMNKLEFNVFCRYSTNLQINLIPHYPNEMNGFHIEYLNKSQLISRMPEIYELTIDAFRSAPLFQMTGYENFFYKYSSDLVNLDTELMPFVLNDDNKIVAYLLAYPSWNKDVLTVKTLARNPARIYAGTGKLLANEIVNKALELGYNSILHAFMNQNNVSNILSKNISGVPFKNYMVYSYEL